MQTHNTVFRQTDAGMFSVERLPDGSTAILDRRSKQVHSLNSSATTLWQACSGGATLPQLSEAFAAKHGASPDPQVVQAALRRLQQAGLVESDSSFPNVDANRRAVLQRTAAAAAIAVPVILTLTASQQRAFAFQANSQAVPAPGRK